MKANEVHLQPVDTATITVLVTNVGGATGTYEVVLKLNGEVYAKKSVTLDAGKSETVSFGVLPADGKELHAILTIDDLSVDVLWEIH